MAQTLAQKAYQKAHYEANAERIKERQKAYAEVHKEQIKRKDRTYREANKGKIKKRMKAYCETHKEQIKEHMKAYRETYYPDRGRDLRIKKLTGDPTKGLHWYNGLLDLQGHVCAVCQDVVEDATGKGHTLHVDHCHETGQARELLCSHCNTALGLFRDREDLLAAAIAYLQKHRRRSIHEERRTFYAIHPQPANKEIQSS